MSFMLTDRELPSPANHSVPARAADLGRRVTLPAIGAGSENTSLIRSGKSSAVFTSVVVLGSIFDLLLSDTGRENPVVRVFSESQFMLLTDCLCVCALLACRTSR